MKFKNLLLFLFFAAISLLVLIPNKFEVEDHSKVFYYSIISFVSIAFYTFVFKGLYKSWVRFETFFLIGFIIVHFQIPFLLSLDIQPTNAEFILLNEQLINFAAWLSAMVIHVWLFASTLGNYQLIQKYSSKKKITYTTFTYNIPKLDLIILISFLIFMGTAGSSLLSSTYRGLGSGGEIGSYAIIILRVSLYIRIFLFFKDLQKVTPLNIFRNNIIFLFILFTYIFLFILSGDRGPFLQILIVIAFCYGIFQKAFSFKFLLISVFVGAIFLSVIGLGRGTDDNMFKGGYATYSASEKLPTEELASSVRILYRALEYFPHKMDYLNGTQLLLGLTGAVPFLSGFITTSFGIPPEITSSSGLFTFIGQGPNATYGEGTEIISDLYINVGFAGLFIIIFFYGFITSRISFHAVLLKSDKFMLILIVLVSTALYINRAQFLTPLKDIIYILLIFYLIRSQAKKKTN